MADGYSASSDVTANTDATALQYNNLRADVQTWHKFIVKTANESVTADTTLQADNALNFAVAASEKWIIRVHLKVTCGATSGFKMQCTVPSSPTLNVGWANVTEASVSTNLLWASTSSNGVTTGNSLFIVAEHYLENGANTGNFVVTWAQNASSANTTTVLQSSYLTARRIA